MNDTHLQVEPGLHLIETIFWDGRRAPHWPEHRARLYRGAQMLGWPVPSVLAPDDIAKTHLMPARLRLSLYEDDQAIWQVKNFEADGRAIWRAMVSERRLTSHDPWLRLKSSKRPIHDAVRQSLPDDIDEAILCNERGEVCEGTITNVFFDRGQGMRTPPLSCGLLPGVLRTTLALPEEKLMRAELSGLKGLWVGNALRGMIPVQLLQC